MCYFMRRLVEPLSRPAPACRARQRRAWLGEADVQGEVPEPQVEYSAAGPVHDERQQDDGQDYHDHPEEEHDDAGDGIPRYSSRFSHRCQLPAAARLIQPIRRGLPSTKRRQAGGRRHGDEFADEAPGDPTPGPGTALGAIAG